MSQSDPNITLLDHTADVGIEARGKTLKEAFENAARGMMMLMMNLDTVTVKEYRTITIEAPDRDSLLVRWLSELLYLFDAEKFIACTCEIQLLHSNGLSATVGGELLDHEKHETNVYVKAVTYHQLSIDSASRFSGTSGTGGTEHQTVIRVYLDI
jgi:SHS2 domain-containing protein